MNQKIQMYVKQQFTKTDATDWSLKMCVAYLELFYVGGLRGFMDSKGRK